MRKLHTQFQDGALILSLEEDRDLIAETREEFSEHYLRAIETIIDGNGGWELINEWEVCFSGGSFTSVRGLAVLINTLASIHDVSVFLKDGDSVSRTSLPIEPIYYAEPNITKKGN